MSLTVDQNMNQSVNVLSDDTNHESDDNNKENTDYSSLKFSDILFTDDSGLSLHFAMRPCRERKTVRTLIERGGGYMSSYSLHSDQLINLVIKDVNLKDYRKSNLKLYYLTFVYDSCKANTLLDLNQYLIQTTTIEKSSDCDESERQLNDINDKQEDNNPNDKSFDPLPSEDLSQTNQCLEQKAVNQSVEDNVSESDFNEDVAEESDEMKSKYFKTNEKFLHKRKLKTEDNKKPYFNAYLDFIKQRETSNTPENLMRIKQALKVSVEEQTNETNNQKSQPSVCDKNNPKSSEDMPFGAKVVTKTRNENKKLKESKSEEKGYQISDISSEENSDHQKNDQIIKRQMIDKKLKLNKNVLKQSSSYCLTEDESILEFVIKTKRFNELKGNSLWKEAEKQDVCEGRSWQSMKERFRRHIMPNIDGYDITKKEKQRIKVCFFSTDLDTTRVQSSSYTYEEDMAIINNVIKNNGYELVKGNAFWKQMAEQFKRKKVCDRSWSSLRERYLKRIVPSLDKYEVRLEFAQKIVQWTGLSTNEIKIILRKCEKRSLKPKADKKRALDIRQVQNSQQKTQNSSSNTEVETSDEQIEGSKRSKRIKK